MITKDNFKKCLRSREEADDFYNQIAKLGVEMIDTKPELAIEVLFKEILSENFTEEGIDLVYWWLYDDVKKVIYEADGSETDLEDIDSLYDYLVEGYLASE